MKRKPAFIAKAGSSIVTAYRHGKPEGEREQRYVLTWRRFAGDERQRETATGEKAAKKRAGEIVKELADGRGQVLELTHADREAWLAAKKLLEPHGIPIVTAVEQWAEARKALGPAGDLVGAVRGFLAQADVATRPAPPTKTILAELLSRVEDDRRSTKYFKALEKDLGRFAEKVPDLARADEGAIRTYLRSLRTKAGAELGERRTDNIRDAIVLLSRFARERGYLPEVKESAAEKIPRRSPAAEIGTFTVAQIDGLLRNVSPYFLPMFALGAFAGIRHSEILRMSWEHLRWPQRSISVPAVIARKVRIGRTVPMLDALVAWLAPYAERTGRIYPEKETTIKGRHDRELGRLAKALGFSWVDNGLRHSFASNRLAIVKSIDQVALEMGNSPAKIRTNYHDPKSEPEATAYFGLRPEVPKNVAMLTAS